jgi:hypothetical protein
MPAISNGTLISSLFRHVPPTSYSGSLNQPVTLPRYFLTSALLLSPPQAPPEAKARRRREKLAFFYVTYGVSARDFGEF